MKLKDLDRSNYLEQNFIPLTILFSDLQSSHKQQNRAGGCIIERLFCEFFRLTENILLYWTWINISM